LNAEEVASTVWPQLRQIARNNEFAVVARVDLLLGGCYRIGPEELKREMEEKFHGSCFDGAAVHVGILEAGQEYQAPGRGERGVSNGWELLITHIEGRK